MPLKGCWDSCHRKSWIVPDGRNCSSLFWCLWRSDFFQPVSIADKLLELCSYYEVAWKCLPQEHLKDKQKLACGWGVLGCRMGSSLFLHFPQLLLAPVWETPENTLNSLCYSCLLSLFSGNASTLKHKLRPSYSLPEVVTVWKSRSWKIVTFI